MYKKLPPETKEKAIELYNSGLTLEQVAQELNIGWTTAQKYISSAHQGRKRGRIAAKKDEGLKLYAAGLNLREVAEKLGVHFSTVKRWVDSSDVVMRKRGNKSDSYRIVLKISDGKKTQPPAVKQKRKTGKKPGRKPKAASGHSAEFRNLAIMFWNCGASVADIITVFHIPELLLLDWIEKG